MRIIRGLPTMVIMIIELKFAKSYISFCMLQFQKLMKIYSKDKELEAAATREAQNSVDDQEMAERYV